MPQPRKYETRAQQQAAYRQRAARSQQDLLSRKGLPSLPAIPTMPGNARWSAMLEQAHILLAEAVQEMQNYHDERSEPWQGSERAEELLARMEYLQETLSHLEAAL